MTTPPRPLPRLFVVLLLVVIQMGIALPVLPALTLALGGNAVDIGLLYAIQSFGQFAMSPVWGAMSDRLGRKRVILLTIALVSVFEVAAAFAPTLFVFYLCRLAIGLAAGSIAAASALIADVTTVESRSRGMAVVGISFGLGFTIGPAIGAGLGYIGADGPGPLADGLPFLVAGIIGAFTLVLGAWILREPAKSADERVASRSSRPTFGELRELLRDRTVHAMLVLNFMYTLAASVLESTFFVFAFGRYGWDERQVGMVFAGLGLLMAFLQGGVGRASGRFGDRRMVAFGLVLVGSGLIIAPFFTWAPILLVFLGVSTAGRAFAHPGILALMSSTAPARENAGRVMGALQSASSLGRIVGPAVGGAVFFYLHPDAPFWASGALVLLALVWWWHRTDDRED